MMLIVNLPAELERRLEAVSRAVGRSRHDIAIEAIVEEVGDIEDALIVHERIKAGGTESYTLEEVRERLGIP